MLLIKFILLICHKFLCFIFQFLLFLFSFFSVRLQKFKLFWFFVLASCACKKLNVFKCAVGFRLVANGWRYAAYRINITNFSAYKYIKLIHVSFIFTTNCGMQYERVLATGRSSFVCVRAGKLIDKFSFADFCFVRQN